MKIFRNPEIKKITIVYILIFILLSGTAYFYNKSEFILPLSVSFISFWVAEIIFSVKRYGKLENLAYQLDRILHEKDKLDFEEFNEGELSVLKSQLDKVVLRLRQQKEDLQTEKVHLTDSIADISHQLRTPLTSINLIIEFLKSEDVSKERRYQMASDLQKLTNRIDWLINALLKISKIDAGTADFRKEQVKIKDLIEKRASPLAISMDLKDQQLFVNVKDEFFTGDIAWTGESIGNILKNCSEHTPNSGSITVNAEQTAIYTQITIQDTGKGFDREDLPHIFTRFYKGKNASIQSVGIGLALARMIITNQNGTIKAENSPTGGAKFTIKFYHSII